VNSKKKQKRQVVDEINSTIKKDLKKRIKRSKINPKTGKQGQSVNCLFRIMYS